MGTTKRKSTAPKYKDTEGRVKAMRGGIEKWFGEHAWKIGNLEKLGWVKVGVRSDAVEVEAEEIKISEIPDGDVETVDVGGTVADNAQVEYPSEEEMKAFLKEKGVRFNPSIGIDKLKERYDANKE